MKNLRQFRTNAILLCFSQKMRLVSEKDHGEKVKLDNFQIKTVQHELPGDDLTQGRGTMEKASIFNSVRIFDKI